MYIYYNTLYASNSCTRIGTTFSDILLPITNTRDLSSIYQPYNEAMTPAGWIYTYTYDMNDLVSVPAQVYAQQPFCQQQYMESKDGMFDEWDTPGVGWTCDRTEPYRPTIAVPLEVTRLDPAWVNCSGWYGGLYDPPTALRPTTAIATATQPKWATSTAASPGSYVPTTSAAETGASQTTATAASTNNNDSTKATSSTLADDVISGGSKVSGNVPQDTTTAISAVPATVSGSQQAVVTYAHSAGSQDTTSIYSNGPTSVAASESTSTNPDDYSATYQTSSYPAIASMDPSAQPTVLGGESSRSTGWQEQSSDGSHATDPAAVIASLLGSSSASISYSEAGTDPSSAAADPASEIASLLGDTVSVSASATAAQALPSAAPARTTADSPQPPVASTVNSEVLSPAGFPYTAMAQSGISVVGNGGPHAPGQTTKESGASLNIGPSAISSDGSTVPYSLISTSDTLKIVFTLAGQTYTATEDPADSVVAAGSTYAADQLSSLYDGSLSVDGSAVVLGSVTIPHAFEDPTTTAGAVTSAAIFTVGGQVHTLQDHSGSIKLDGIPLIADLLTSVDGEAVSIGSSGLVIAGTTIALSTVGSPSTDVASITSAVFTANSYAYTVVWHSGLLDLGDTSVTVGEITTVNGATLSIASSAVIVDGSTILYSTKSAATTSTIKPTLSGPDTARTVVLLDLDGSTAAATQISGQTGPVLIADSTLSIGGPAVTLNGQAVSDGVQGLVIGGSTTVSLFDAVSPQPSHSPVLTAALASSPVSRAGKCLALNSLIISLFIPLLGTLFLEIL